MPTGYRTTYRYRPVTDGRTGMFANGKLVATYKVVDAYRGRDELPRRLDYQADGIVIHNGRRWVVAAYGSTRAGAERRIRNAIRDVLAKPANP